jgi:hypothetical protein
MRAVITGTDFIKDTDGSFKAIETNTNIGIGVDVTRYLDIDEFTNFVSTNEFNEIVFLYNVKNIIILDNEGELEQKHPNYSKNYNLESFLVNHYSGSNVNIIIQKVDETSITIPNIEDSENKLILRVAYDTTALIDDIYARDNWEFLKLMNDSNPNSIAKTYINDEELGFDSIGTNLRNNGNHPNYCIKKRITPADNNVYPKLLKITTLEQLNSVKTGLESDEYIQEYIVNSSDLLENKLKVYRSVDMVYGPELDVLNLWMQEQTNILDIIDTPDYDDNNQVQIWDRNRYTTKYNTNTNDIAIKFSADAGTKILDVNNNIILVDNLNTGDFVKSVSFPILQNGIDFQTMSNWTGSIDSIVTEYNVTSSQVVSKIEKPYFGEIIELELENGTIFSDVPHATILAKSEVSGSLVSKFINYELLETGSIVFLWDNNTDTIVSSSITELKYSYQKLTAYTLNVDEFDLFLTLEESDTNRYGLITHNYDYDCKTISCGAEQMSAQCITCGSGFSTPPCLTNASCCRFGDNYTPLPWVCTEWNGYWGQCNLGILTASDLGFCNANKPSDTNLKTDVKFLTKSEEGLHIYSFKYVDYIKELWLEETGEDLEGTWAGVMAQELIGTKWEDALSKHSKGFYVVNYNKLPNIQILKK